jgi:hypothetical protein
MPVTKPITVVPFEPSRANEWTKFLHSSDNGTLFHDLDFLAYHPEGRFDFHHLLFFQGEELIALLPGAIVAHENCRKFISPAGASVGGFVLPPRISVSCAIGICRELQKHMDRMECGQIEFRIGPGYYSRLLAETQSFALAATGFLLQKRWICPRISLPGDGDVAAIVPSAKRRSSVRTALGRDLRVEPAGIDRLPEFYSVLKANRAKHNALPTHTEAELCWLLQHLPERIRLFTCTFENRIIGGTVMFDLNERITYWFYPCHDDEFQSFRVPTVVLFRMFEEYLRRGFSHIDLGPTGDADLSACAYRLNEGNLFFKEEMGGIGHCRDTWVWKKNS